MILEVKHHTGLTESGGIGWNLHKLRVVNGPMECIVKGDFYDCRVFYDAGQALSAKNVSAF